MIPGTLYRKPDGRERVFVRAYRDERTCTDLVVATFREPGKPEETRSVTAEAWRVMRIGCVVVAPALADVAGG